MKITIAIDSFKGSLTSMEAGTAAMEGVKAAFPDASVYVRPLADGGEGTVEALVDGMGGRILLGIRWNAATVSSKKKKQLS